MGIIENIEREQLRRDIPQFKAGDTVKVHFRVVEGTRQRTQLYQGIVIKRQGQGVRETFTVRKISYGVGVERVFPLHSPKIVKVVRVREGRVRRSKLYYLRGRTGKAAKVTQLIRRKRVAVVPETGTDETASSAAEPAGQPEQ